MDEERVETTMQIKARNVHKNNFIYLWPADNLIFPNKNSVHSASNLFEPRDDVTFGERIIPYTPHFFNSKATMLKQRLR